MINIGKAFIEDDGKIPHWDNNLKLHMDRCQSPVWIYDGYDTQFLYGNEKAVSAFGNKSVADFLHTKFKNTSNATKLWSQRIISCELRYHRQIVLPWMFYTNDMHQTPFQETCRISGIYVRNRLCMMVEVMQSEEHDIHIENDMKLTYEAYRYSPELVSIMDRNGVVLKQNFEAQNYYTHAMKQNANVLHGNMMENPLKAIIVHESDYEKMMEELNKNQKFKTNRMQVHSEWDTLKVYHRFSIGVVKNPIDGTDMIIVHQSDVTEEHKMEDTSLTTHGSTVLFNQSQQHLLTISNMATTLLKGKRIVCPASIGRIAQSIYTSSCTVYRHVQNVATYTNLFDKNVQLQRKMVNLHEIVSRMVQQTIVPLEKNSKVDVQYQVPRDCHAFMDVHYMQIALQNLIDCAIQQSVQGKILISASTVHDHTVICIRASSKNVAQYFYDETLQENPKCIGLPLAKKIIHLHQGTISVSSTETPQSALVIHFRSNMNQKSTKTLCQDVESTTLNDTKLDSSIEKSNLQEKQLSDKLQNTSIVQVLQSRILQLEGQLKLNTNQEIEKLKVNQNALILRIKELSMIGLA